MRRVCSQAQCNYLTAASGRQLQSTARGHHDAVEEQEHKCVYSSCKVGITMPLWPAFQPSEQRDGNCLAPRRNLSPRRLAKHVQQDLVELLVVIGVAVMPGARDDEVRDAVRGVRPQHNFARKNIHKSRRQNAKFMHHTCDAAWWSVLG